MRLLKDSHGLTIIELIATLTIIGVISAVAISKVSATDTYSLTSEAETLKSHLRFAQARAMSDEVPWGISISSTSYTLFKTGGGGCNLPGENSAAHTLQNGVSITSGAVTIAFDKWGSPGTLDKTITFSGSHTITVTKNTGFIQ